MARVVRIASIAPRAARRSAARSHPRLDDVATADDETHVRPLSTLEARSCSRFLRDNAGVPVLTRQFQGAAGGTTPRSSVQVARARARSSPRYGLQRADDGAFCRRHDLSPAVARLPLAAGFVLQIISCSNGTVATTSLYGQGGPDGRSARSAASSPADEFIEASRRIRTPRRRAR